MQRHTLTKLAYLALGAAAAISAQDLTITNARNKFSKTYAAH